MKTYQFKTSAKCGGCTTKIDQKLKSNPNAGTWRFDLQNPDRILEITTDLPPEEVVKLVEDAGYKAELKA
ncbi:MAG: heavy metal-associated domain-containing protein [Clostridiales bacterium]